MQRRSRRKEREGGCLFRANAMIKEDSEEGSLLTSNKGKQEEEEEKEVKESTQRGEDVTKEMKTRSELMEQKERVEGRQARRRQRCPGVCREMSHAQHQLPGGSEEEDI